MNERNQWGPFEYSLEAGMGTLLAAYGFVTAYAAYENGMMSECALLGLVGTFGLGVVYDGVRRFGNSNC